MAHPKGLLIERAQKLGLPRPDFQTAQTGPEHEPTFLTDVTVDGELLGTGQGGSKRDSERYAAEEALLALERRDPAGKGAERKEGKSADRKPEKPEKPEKSETPAERKTSKPAKGKAAADDTKGRAEGKGKKERKGGRAAEREKPLAASEVGERESALAEADAATDRASAGSEPGTEDEAFTGPWPMVDDFLASVVQVAEKRVNADLRGDAALEAIRDFSLRLYKEILADLGEVVDEYDDDDDTDDDD